MVDYYSLKKLELPDTPIGVARHDEIRKHITSSFAYIYLSLNESPVQVNSDNYAAAMTDTTHNLEQNLTAKEYLEAACGEVSLAEDILQNEIEKMPQNIPVQMLEQETKQDIISDFDIMQTRLNYLYQNLNRILNNTY